jgi:hypothetical protein
LKGGEGKGKRKGRRREGGRERGPIYMVINDHVVLRLRLLFCLVNCCVSGGAKDKK